MKTVLIPLMKTKKIRAKSDCCVCGSKTHKRRTSHKCPLNPKFKPPAAVTTDPAAVTTDPAAVTADPAAVTADTAAVTTDPAAVTTDPAGPPSKKRRRLTKTHCKCESKTHKTTRSRACPLNKDNRAAAAQLPPQPSPPPQPSTPTLNNAVPVPIPPNPPRFRVGDNVLAQFKKNQWYLAQLTHCVGGRYTVYFPDDGNVKKNLRPNQIRPVDPSCTYPRRGSMIGVRWQFEGDEDLSPGEWLVRRIEGNTYICTRISKAPVGEPNSDAFDIGYVINQRLQQLQELQETGPTF